MAVYLSVLEIENVRCFQSQQLLDLRSADGKLSQWTLLLGENGVGKTTLLQCLVWMRPVLIDEPSAEGKRREYAGPVLQEEPENETLLRLASNNTTTANLTAHFVEEMEFGQQTPDSQGFRTSFSLKLQQTGDRAELEEYAGDGTKGVAPEYLLIAYGANRIMKKSESSSSIEEIDATASLYEDFTYLYDAVEILSNLDYAVQKQKGKTKNKLKNQRDSMLKAIVRVIPGVKEILLLGPRSISGVAGGVWVKTSSGRFSLAEISLGHRTIFALIVDIAWRLISKYPDSNAPLSEPAIVLIDEIDLHLHPNWQRTIMKELSEAFPNVQFIATAHSPLMVQEATSQNIAVLVETENGVEIRNTPPEVEGWRVDQILTSEIFGIPLARSTETEWWFARRDELLEENERTPEQEEELQSLHSRIHSLRTADDASSELVDDATSIQQLIKQLKAERK